MTDASALDNIPGNSASLKLQKKEKTDSTEDDNTKNVEIMVPLKYLRNFWKNLQMPIINGKINLILTWSQNCVTSNTAAKQATTFAVTNAKLYVTICNLINW